MGAPFELPEGLEGKFGDLGYLLGLGKVVTVCTLAIGSTRIAVFETRAIVFVTLHSLANAVATSLFCLGYVFDRLASRCIPLGLFCIIDHHRLLQALWLYHKEIFVDERSDVCLVGHSLILLVL